MVVMCVAALVLLGWVFNIPSLKRIHPDWVSMVPNTALSLLGLGVVLWRQSSLSGSVARHQTGRWLVMLVLAGRHVGAAKPAGPRFRH